MRNEARQAMQRTPGQPDWSDWQPPAPAIPPHLMTRVCEDCQTLNRDTAQYCRRCARKLSPVRNLRAVEPHPDAASFTRAQRSGSASRRVLGIPVPPGVDTSIVWLLLVLALLHAAFVLWYLGRSPTQGPPLSLPGPGVWQSASAPERQPIAEAPRAAPPAAEVAREPDRSEAPAQAVALQRTLPTPTPPPLAVDDPAPAPVETAVVPPLAGPAATPDEALRTSPPRPAFTARARAPVPARADEPSETVETARIAPPAMTEPQAKVNESRGTSDATSDVTGAATAPARVPPPARQEAVELRPRPTPGAQVQMASRRPAVPSSHCDRSNPFGEAVCLDSRSPGQVAQPSRSDARNAGGVRPGGSNVGKNDRWMFAAGGGDGTGGGSGGPGGGAGAGGAGAGAGGGGAGAGGGGAGAGGGGAGAGGGGAGAGGGGAGGAGAGGGGAGAGGGGAGPGGGGSGGGGSGGGGSGGGGSGGGGSGGGGSGGGGAGGGGSGGGGSGGGGSGGGGGGGPGGGGGGGGPGGGGGGGGGR